MKKGIALLAFCDASGVFAEAACRKPFILAARPIILYLWSGRRDSNSRQPAWKAGTLPTELLPLDAK